MQKIIILIVVFPMCLFAQNKDDNAIVIHEQISFSHLKQTLFDNGFQITNSDSVFISTTELNMSGTSFTIKFLINRQDSITIVKGFIKSLLELSLSGVKANSEFTPVIFKGAKNGDLKKAWSIMDKL